MICLCCGKKIDESKLDKSDFFNLWHISCIKKFFGTKELPIVDINNEVMADILRKNVNEGLAVTGVQKKLSLHLSKGKDKRLTLVGYPAGYILKPQTEEYAQLPESEALVMHMADIAGISTVKHALLKLSDGSFGYITTRQDRYNDNLYAMEDFCQLGGRITADKYKGSYEQCGSLIKKYSSKTGLDLSEFFMRIVFSFVVGNSDMHLKNFSLIETAPSNREFVLSPAYDLLPVNVILPSDKDQMALTLNGKKRNLRKKDFFALADNIGITKKSAENILYSVINDKERFIECINNSLMSLDYKTRLTSLLIDRIDSIS